MSYLLRGTMTLLALVAAMPACSGNDFGPTPTISELTIQSPLALDATEVAGSVHVTDPLGLTTLTANLSVTNASGTQTLPPAVMDGPVEGQTEANVRFRIKRPTQFPAGTYDVNVTLLEDGTASNSLSVTVVVE